jgi:DNA-binding MarR family transcriptional regulator
MTGKKIEDENNKYKIMSKISENEKITQRELSKELNLSVSTVNILMKKMITEGLIKMNQVSSRQVLYMLTPTGISEKALKTVSYLKGHYKAISENKEKIKQLLIELDLKGNDIFILINDIEMKAIVNDVVEHIESNSIKFINNISEISTVINKQAVLIYLSVNQEDLIAFKKISNLLLIDLVNKL